MNNRQKKQVKSSFGRIKQNIFNTALRRGSLPTTLISTLIAGFLGFLTYYFLFAGFFAENSALTQKVEAVEAENRRGQAIEKSQPAFEREFRRLVALSDSAEPLLPNDTELAQVMYAVEEIARRQQVVLTGLNAGQGGKKSDITYRDEKAQVTVADKVYERQIPAQVSGNYAAVVRFFYDLARLSRIIVVKDFQLLAEPNNQVTASFTLAAFQSPPSDEMRKLSPLPPFIEPTRSNLANNTSPVQ